MLRYFLISYYLLLALSTGAQEARQYAWRHHTTLNGLASNLVHDVVQDDEGYLWIATLNGLQRYDGYNFILFTHETGQVSSLPTNQIVALHKDPQGRLWVMGSNNEIGLFDTHRFRFRRVPVQGLLPQSSYAPKYLFSSADGQLYLHEVNHGFFRYHPQRNRFVPDPGFLAAPGGWRISKVAWDATRKTYWATADSGLLQYRFSSKGVQVLQSGMQPVIVVSDPGKGALSGLHLSKGGAVYFTGTSNKGGGSTLYRYHPESGKVEPLSSNLTLDKDKEKLILQQQKNGHQWMLRTSLLASFTDSSSRLVSMGGKDVGGNHLRYDEGNALYEDREGNLWIGTDNGLFSFNPEVRLFESYGLVRIGKSAEEVPVQSFQETPEKIWVGTRGQGLFCFDLQLNPLPLPSALNGLSGKKDIRQIHRHRKTGMLWFFMGDGTLQIFKESNGVTSRFSPAALAGQTISKVIEDYQGNLWIGTREGALIKWVFSSAAHAGAGYKLVMQTAPVHQLLVQGELLWVATLGKGLLQIDLAGDSMLHVYREQGRTGRRLGSNNVTDIVALNDTTILALAGNINLVDPQTHTVVQLGADDGVLPSNSARSVQLDDKGILWVGMANGLCRVHLQQRIFTFYDRRDGIPNDNFPVAGAYRISDGRMLFATNRNFLVFEPGRTRSVATPVQPRLTSLHSGNSRFSLDSLQEEGRLVLPYHQNSVSFDFSSLSFSPHSKLQYFYRLDGIDKNWKLAAGAPRAVYNYLPPGRYSLRLRAENGDGISSAEFSLFPIVIRPPFWQSWWFYCVLALLVGGGLLWLDYERMRRIRILQQTRLQIAGNLHHELNTTLNHINILSEMARIKSSHDPVQAVGYMDQISERSHNMIILMDDMIWSIDPGKDSLEATLVRLQEFVAGLQSRHEAIIQVEVGKEVPRLQLDMKKRHELFITLKEVLRLAVEQGGSRDLHLALNLEKKRLVVTLQDASASLLLSDPVISQKMDAMQTRIAAVAGELKVQGQPLIAYLHVPV